jgi:hypothetical protein
MDKEPIALRYKNINYFKCRKTFEMPTSEKKNNKESQFFYISSEAEKSTLT